MEIDLYDFNAIVASVGGSLGLFLGFSCYEYGKRLIDRLPNCSFQSKVKSMTIKEDRAVANYLNDNIQHIA